MKELVEHWWVVTLRGVAALILAVSLWIVPPMLRHLLFEIFLSPFIFVLFGSYIVLDSLLLFLLVHRIRVQRSFRTVFIFQAISGIAIGVTVVLSMRATLHWFVPLSICQSALTGAYEIVVASHLRKHLCEERTVFLVGIGSLLCSAALLVLYNGEISRAFDWIVAYAGFFGLTLIWLSLRLRNFAHPQEPLPHIQQQSA